MDLEVPWFTVWCCSIFQYVGIYEYDVNISNYIFTGYFAKEMNLEETIFHITLPKRFYSYKNLNFLGEKWGQGWHYGSQNWAAKLVLMNFTSSTNGPKFDVQLKQILLFDF